MPYGCWGDGTDQYYGGRAYGEMLKQVYPAIKSADPEAQVLVGGLLLDCDRRIIGREDGDMQPGKFYLAGSSPLYLDWEKGPTSP